MGQQRKWSELTPSQRAGIVAMGAVELVLTTVALRDLARRDRIAVRGPKWAWRLTCLVQPVGPVLYLVAGRRHGTTPAP